MVRDMLCVAVVHTYTSFLSLSTSRWSRWNSLLVRTSKAVKRNHECLHLYLDNTAGTAVEQLTHRIPPNQASGAALSGSSPSSPSAAVLTPVAAAACCQLAPAPSPGRGAQKGEDKRMDREECMSPVPIPVQDWYRYSQWMAQELSWILPTLELASCFCRDLVLSSRAFFSLSFSSTLSRKFLIREAHSSREDSAPLLTYL